MVRILICDESTEAAAFLSKYIERFFCNHHTKYQIYCFPTPAAVAQAGRIPFDIAFINIEPTGTEGFRFLSELKQHRPFLLAFIMANSDRFLDDAIHRHVDGYLSKPAEPRRINKNMAYALREYYNQYRSLVIHYNHQTHRILSREIIYITTANRKTRVRTPRGEILCDETLAQWYDQLIEPQHFAFSHNSFLVNLAYVTAFDKTSVTVRIDDHTTELLHMSQRRYADFKNSFLSYMENTP